MMPFKFALGTCHLKLDFVKHAPMMTKKKTTAKVNSLHINIFTSKLACYHDLHTTYYNQVY